MQIERLEMYPLKVPLAKPFAAAGETLTRRTALLIRLISGGAEGWGECGAFETPWYSEETTAGALKVIQHSIAPKILKIELNDAAQLRETMAWIRGHRMAKAAVEMAFYDLLADAKKVSLKKLLGGTRKEVEASLTLGFEDDPAKTAGQIEKGLALGYKKIKLKIAPGRDLKPLKELRKLFPQAPLSVDGNGTYGRRDLSCLKALDALGLLMIEQPFEGRSFVEHASLKAVLRTPVALDEGIESAQDAASALEIGAAGAINVKAARVGGFGESLAIHRAGMAARIPMFVGGLLELGVGRLHALALASLKGFSLPADLSESARYYREDIIEPPITLSPRGTLEVPAEKGGVKRRIRMEKLKKYLVNLSSLMILLFLTKLLTISEINIIFLTL